MMRMVQSVAKRRWFRFNLRVLLIVMTVLCVWLGFNVCLRSANSEAI